MGIIDKVIDVLASFIQKTWKYDLGIAITLSAVLSLLLWYRNKKHDKDSSESSEE